MATIVKNIRCNILSVLLEKCKLLKNYKLSQLHKFCAIVLPLDGDYF